jgi:hypothetical protein
MASKGDQLSSRDFGLDSSMIDVRGDLPRLVVSSMSPRICRWEWSRSKSLGAGITALISPRTPAKAISLALVKLLFVIVRSIAKGNQRSLKTWCA